MRATCIHVSMSFKKYAVKHIQTTFFIILFNKPHLHCGSTQKSNQKGQEPTNGKLTPEQPGYTTHHTTGFSNNTPPFCRARMPPKQSRIKY